MKKQTPMTDEEYHADPAVGSTGIRTILDRSPAHYLYDRENPSESTPAQRLGHAVHKAILEPEIFKKAIVEPEFEGKGSRAEKEAFHLEHHGKLILKREQHDMIGGILKSISAHEYGKKVLAAGAAEMPYFWEDDETGVNCKCKPDFLRENHIVADVKTTTCASEFSFFKDFANYGYHIQAGFYLDGISKSLDHKFDEFVIIAIEKDPPYAVNCFLIDESAINEGRALYYQALKTLAECIKTGKFPAYSQNLKTLNLPSWAYRGLV